eukprot:TRINITY_DN1096_c0_g1_i1.p1 TRINITY_DN1096_c0_g1~~TRINITY_DN1096_c0_g1_i1.p1  ORF type:complete len:632 (-),score=175.70 TRINITY_DN1096_c0_g1_i1:62-1957(-)
MSVASVSSPIVEKKEGKETFPREAFKKLTTQRFFIAPAFELYGGVTGLYDLGPPGCAVKANILSLWRQWFILTENMLEIDSSCVTPKPVLEASGHVARFTDLMVKDAVTGACYRADHRLEEHLETLLADKNLTAEKIDEIKTVMAQADALSKEEMHEALKKYNTKAPETGNELTFPEPFNLMFATSIGPTGTVPGFLRPETAQGIFVNFKRLLEFNGGKLPFAAAQIGQAYRNEIAPRSGLLRVREFTLAEIEHFVNPEDKDHPKFASIANLEINAFPRDVQLTTKQTVRMTIGDAVKNGVINNQTLGYFIARVHGFLLACGVKADKLRFRQHLSDEMAHYAADCWDAEILNSYGWTECVGIADRSAYDLNAHSAATKQSLTAFVEFKEGPKMIETIFPKLDKGKIGKALGKKQANLVQFLTNLDQETAEKLEKDLQTNGSVKITLGEEEYEVKKEYILEWTREKKNVSGAKITPGVIEPSFGIGRILYSVLEHAYWCRENDEQRAVLSLPPTIAPVKVTLFPLQSKQNEALPQYANLLTDYNISFRVDDTGASIGKRYSRADEIGIPFGITVDFASQTDKSVTLRERDSTAQVRVPFDSLAVVLNKLISGRANWEQIKNEPGVEVVVATA